MKIYGDAIKMCLNLHQSSHSRKLKINAELLLIRIQNQIKNKFKTSNRIDLLNFVSEHTFIAKLKQKMLKQTSLQIRICSEIMKDSPDLELIYQNSQKAHISRQIITKKINQISTRISDSHIEPLALAAKYSLTLNHSITDYINFTKLSLQKLEKHQKIFAQENLCLENIFQENVGFLMISGAKGEAGKIIYATKQIEYFLGGDSSQYPGVYLPQRTPPILRSLFIQRWKQLSENPETSAFGRIGRSFFYHIDGYVVEVEYFVDIHPFTTQGFNFVFVSRPVVSNREYLLLHENGDIDCSSKGLIEKLGLNPQAERINIKLLNEELAEVNQAFNKIAFPQKYDLKELDEANEIYSKYTTEGVNLLVKSQHNPDLDYSYNCKIQNLVIESSFIKILSFEENKKENQTNEQLFQSRESHRNKNGHGISSSSQNFASLEMAKKHSSPLPGIQSQKTDGEYLSDNGPLSTERQLIPSRPRTKKRHHSKLFNHTLKRFDENDNKVPFSFSAVSNEDEDEVIYRKAKTHQNLGQMSQEKQISNLLQMSLDSRSYSKKFKGLTFGFYIALLIIILLRIFLKFISADYMNSLVAKKDIFSMNGYRSYILIENSGLARFVWQFTSRALDLSGYPPDIAESLEIIKTFVIGNIQNLRAANRIVLEASSVLSGEAHDAVFQKNVAVYNTYFDAPEQNFVMMDSLQATDHVVEAALAVYDSFFDSVFDPEMTSRAQFLFRNSLNELILKNSQLSNSMLNSFNEQFSDLKTLSVGFMVIFIALVSVLFGVAIFFIKKQYSSDLSFISAVCRLKHSQIQVIHKELINFQKYLTQQKDPIEEIERDVTLMKSQKTSEETSLSRRETVKTPNNRALRSRHLRKILWSVLALVLLVVLLNLNAVILNSRLNKIKSAQEKLYFANHIRIRMSLASTTFRELTATNNTAYVENREALTELEFLLEQLVSIRTKIYSTLLTEELIEKNPEIETLLLGDGCSLLGSSFDSNCEFVKRKGMSSGFINLLNEFEAYLREKLEIYKNSDRSGGVLAGLQTKDYQVKDNIYVIALFEMDLLWKTMDNFFVEKIKEDKKGRRLSLSLFLTSVVLIGIFGWKFLLKGLGESVNRLKNILRVFPAGLVLSNFTLKAFLMKNSKVGLEHVRNEI